MDRERRLVEGEMGVLEAEISMGWYCDCVESEYKKAGKGDGRADEHDRAGPVI